MHNTIALVVISLALAMLFTLAGEAKLFIDVYVLGFLVAFVYAATIIAFGVDGFIRSISGLKCLFTQEIKGGNAATYLAKIYQYQIRFCYGAALIALAIGSVAIHGNVELVKPETIHRAYAVNLLAILYAAIVCEGIFRPLLVKLKTCDLSQ